MSKNDTSEENPFTQYYAQMMHQGNMLQDTVRTGTYQQSMLQNTRDFAGKVVLDVGTGTGILSFFAAQAGAKKVYAVEASGSADVARALAHNNGYGNVVEVVRGKVEEITLPEKVDVIISEPIGFLLVHERMIESYVVARDRFLKPKGRMYPTTGSIVFAPMTDDALFREQMSKTVFWETTNFYGLDLSSVKERAIREYFAQPVVGNFPVTSLLSLNRTVHSIDFTSVTLPELQQFTINFNFRIDKTAMMHGFGCWFDINFIGSSATVVLSTAPDQPGTHWYQCRLLLRDPIAVNKGQSISGSLKFTANEKFSYFIDVAVALDGTHVTSENRINLQDQMYHYLNATSAPEY